MILAAVAALLTTAAVAAQHMEHGMAMPPMQSAPPVTCSPEHAAMGHCTPTSAATPSAMTPAPPPGGASPPPSSEPEHAADAIWGADAMTPARRAIYAEHGAMRTTMLMLDRLEYRARKRRDGYRWDGEGWWGGDCDRLWIKSQGEGRVGGSVEGAELQALWSRAIDPWFNLQAGVRYDVRPTPSRAHLAIGVEGLAPYLFEVDAAAFLSTHGDLTARVELEDDQRIAGQLILQPRVEINFSAQDVHAIGLGSGVTSVETGLRLRYELTPDFAPYVGLDYERNVGRAARYARTVDDRVGGLGIVAGMRVWF